MKNLLVTGSHGQLGRDLINFLSDKYSVSGFDIDTADINDIESLKPIFEKEKPEVVLHTAAYTDVDGCESDIETAMKVNADGTENIVRCCLKFNSRLVYYSTDYVFDGGVSGRSYVENDIPNPMAIYGKSKLEGENRIRNILDNYAIMRIAWVYGRFGKNFVKTMLKLGKMQIKKANAGEEIIPIKIVNDQIGNPTWTMEIARQTETLIDSDLTGIFHCTSESTASWYDFASEIFRLMKMDVKIVPCTTDQFPRPAKRPVNSVLENRRLKELNINIMTDYKSALNQFLTSDGEDIKNEV